jgi:uncharacterized protein
VILFDTGPIVAAAAENDEHFHVSSQLFTGLRLANRRLILPATVSAEVGYLLSERVGPEVEVQFLQGVGGGAFDLVDLTHADYRRMAELTEQHIDMPLGTTDASVVAIAERLGITEIATLDRRHFTAVRPRHVEAFSLLPERF